MPGWPSTILVDATDTIEFANDRFELPVTILA
jgi:hypothetical protein